MRARYLLDTDICIFLRKQRPPAVVAKFATLAAGEAAISTITYGEFCRGAHRHNKPIEILRLIDELLAMVPALSLPVAAGAAYGSVRCALERGGNIIPARVDINPLSATESSSFLKKRTKKLLSNADITMRETGWHASRYRRRDKSLLVLFFRKEHFLPGFLEPQESISTRIGIIGANDLWIAAHALASGPVLVTNNVREFDRVPGLRIENWARD